MKGRGIIVIMLISIGLIFVLIGSYNAYLSYDFEKNAKETTATITEIKVTESEEESADGSKHTQKHYNVYASYDFEGKHYDNVLLDYYTANMQVGKEIRIYVNTYKPREAKLNKEGGVQGNVAFALVGAALFVAGILVATVVGKNTKMMLESPKIYATISEIKQLELGTRTYYYVECKEYGVENGRVFKSEITSEEIGREYLHRIVPVYINKNDESKYFVNLEEVV